MNYIIKKDINPIYELFKTFYYLANEDEEIESFNKTLDKESLDKSKLTKNILAKKLFVLESLSFISLK